VSFPPPIHLHKETVTLINVDRCQPTVNTIYEKAYRVLGSVVCDSLKESYPSGGNKNYFPFVIAQYHVFWVTKWTKWWVLSGYPSNDRCNPNLSRCMICNLIVNLEHLHQHST